MVKHVDGHQVIEMLGRGGMGTVYRVKDPFTGGQLALKWLNPGVTRTSLERLRFEREFHLAGQCDHPYLVKAHRYGEYQGQPYYTMELIDGKNFRDFLNPYGAPLNLEQITRSTSVVERLLEGLAYIHENSIIHRDLKPENVLVESEGIPRILDFGLARVQALEEGASSRERWTLPGTVLGTPHYMAPEQLSEQPLDPRLDLFALGVMLYEAFSGQLPFGGEAYEVMVSILMTEPPPLEEKGVELPTDLSRLIASLLAKQPADRPQSAAQLLEEWRAVFQGTTPLPTVRRVESPEDLFPPRLVGREAELKSFRSWLEKDSTDLMLVTGAGGGGKTRFLQECSSLVTVSGRAQVWSQAIEVESLPYQLWVPPLQWAAA